MSAKSCARSPASASNRFLSAARLGVLGLAVLAAGCASKQAQQPPTRLAAPPAATQGPNAWAAKVEIEDDGLPVQLAPRHRRPVPDDPSEPWSPNYGKGGPAPGPAQRPAVPPAKAAAMPSPAPVLASANARPARSGGEARLSAVEEEALIRRAVAEHEMRVR